MDNQSYPFNTDYPVLQFGSFSSRNRRTDAPTPRNTPRDKNSPRTPRSQNSPRSPRKTPVKYNNIQEQIDFATGRYEELLKKFMKTPCNRITSKQEEDVWAWGLFSEVVLPMLKIVDED